jgi:hypothetical protein
METVIKFRLNFGHYDYRIKGYQWTRGNKLFATRKEAIVAAAEYIGSFADAHDDTRLIVEFEKNWCAAEEGDAE